MKKFFVLIVFMAVVINAHAQYIADGHHMTYRGVSFAESLQAFRQKLSAKKLEFTHNDPKDLAYLIGEYTSGVLDGDLATISYDEKNGRITKISVSQSQSLCNCLPTSAKRIPMPSSRTLSPRTNGAAEWRSIAGMFCRPTRNTCWGRYTSRLT